MNEGPLFKGTFLKMSSSNPQFSASFVRFQGVVLYHVAGPQLNPISVAMFHHFLVGGFNPSEEY